MKLEEVRKLTRTFNSNKSLPVCGLEPNALRLSFTPAEQTKHVAHLAFSYFINSSEISDFPISQNLLIPHLSLEMLSPTALSRRSDLEILGYCLLRWLCGRLPWEGCLQDPAAVQTAKTK